MAMQWHTQAANTKEDREKANAKEIRKLKGDLDLKDNKEWVRHTTKMG